MCDYIEKLVIECVLNKHRIPYAQDLEILRVRGKHNAVPLCEDSSTRRSITCHISEAKPLQEGRFTCVYRATMSAEGFNPVDVVIKTDMYADTMRPDKFIHEMEVYERDLVSFQASIIPQCFGLYQAHVKDDDDEVQIASFLILKYSGEPINHHTKYAPEFIEEVLEKLVIIHGRGFEHGDFDHRNILIDENSKAKFIDLEDVAPHKCGLNRTIIFDDLLPNHVGCEEIDEAAYIFGVWRRPFVKFYGRDVSIYAVKTGAAETLVEGLNLWGDSGIDHAQALNDAEALIEEVESWREWYNTITDDERHFDFTPKPVKPAPELVKPTPQTVKPAKDQPYGDDSDASASGPCSSLGSGDTGSISDTDSVTPPPSDSH